MRRPEDRCETRAAGIDAYGDTGLSKNPRAVRHNPGGGAYKLPLDSRRVLGVDRQKRLQVFATLRVGPPPARPQPIARSGPSLDGQSKHRAGRGAKKL